MINLAAAFDELDDEQKTAVKHAGNTVVLAGPGSGKTATLVLKVVHLLEAVVEPPQGVACITYNNDAVAEFRTRLSKYGVHASRRLFLGTVHSFCLNCIIRPYGPLLLPELAKGVVVASENIAGGLLKKAAQEHMPGAYFYSPTITKLRRALACGEDASGFDDRAFEVVDTYEATLAAQGLVDFEAMVLRALKLVEEHAWVRNLIAARFPWLVVDEYQDLGGPLHRIVKALVNLAEVEVFAVGDPDQTVYGFTGANPVYLRELTARADFKPIRLRFNYRSGGDLILAGEAALAPEAPRGYQPRPDRKDRGRIEFRQAADALQDHALKAVAAVQECLAAGRPAHEVAIFYRQRNELLADLKVALKAAKVPYIAERETTYPRTLLCRWLQHAAGWALQPEEPEANFNEVSRPYLELLVEAGRADRGADHLTSISKLYEALADSSGDAPLGDWLWQIDHQLELSTLIGEARDRPRDEIESWQYLLFESTEGSMRDHSLRDFADEGRVKGKVVLTTLHSSKGRQFDAVVLPGMVEGVMPPRFWNPTARRMEKPSPLALAEIRRLFYVGLTRARHVVYLIYSDGYTTTKGYFNRWGPSRFLLEIDGRLKRGQ